MEGMKTTQFMLLAFLICVTTAFAVDLPANGDDPNTTSRFDAPESDTTGSYTSLPSWGWRHTGNLNAARELHTATLLQNGLVLVAGGGTDICCEDILVTAELYDPVTHTWSVTGSLNTSRFSHTATLLENGMVLVVGGFDSPSFPSASAELYDPARGTWTATGSLNTARYAHTATLLQNGKVLVAGGDNDGSSLASAELYDRASGTWTVTGSLHNARRHHTATLLPSGMVLVAGGWEVFPALASAELYDPASGSWTVTGSLNTARYSHTATLLENGLLLVAGGRDVDPDKFYLREAELYDPASGIWTVTGSLNRPHYLHTATLLQNGKVLVAGGTSFGGFAKASELYDPASGTWTSTGKLNHGRYWHTATLLQNGTVLIAGGSRHKQVQPFAEVGHEVR